MNNIVTETIEIESSAITSVIYDYEGKKLYISFVSDIKYCYLDVPHDIFISLKYAESVGKYFNEFVKNDYDYKKVA